MRFPTSTFSFVFYFIRQQRIKFLLVALFSIVWGINDSLFPYFLKRIINILQNYVGDAAGIFAAVGGSFLLLLLFWIMTELAIRIQGVVQIYTLPRFRANMRRTVFNYVSHHSHQFFANNFAGTLASKIASMCNSSQMLIECINYNFIPAMTGCITVFIVMWNTKPIFALILAIWLVIHFGLTFLLLKYGNILWVKHADSVTVLEGKVVDAFSNMFSIRLFANKIYEKKYLKHFQDDEISKAKKSMWVMELTRMGLAFNGIFLIGAMVYCLIYGWSNHWVTIGDFTQIGMQTFWLMGWIWHMSQQMSIFAREAATIRDALSMVRKSHDILDAPEAPSIRILNGEITFTDVGFWYRNNKPIFKGLNLKIRSGEKVGLVGFSGSGKTTFVNLILRLYDLQHGKIEIDKQNIADCSQDSLRNQIAMIPQDPMLFHRTLMENIRYGKVDATDDEILAASKLANCHEFIEVLDEGYQSLVGERGIKLSGGQRQRIAIARAILKDAPILILDEATSALDSVTEKLIQKSLQFLMQNRTTIVIAHRLSTLSNMDRILVFHQGEIIEEGTQEQLLEKNGHFALLWKMQTNGLLPVS